MPNWKNPDSYNFPGDKEFLYWAWEFLRRNQNYINDWNNAQEEETNKKISYGKKWGLFEIKNPEIDRPILEWLEIRFPKIVTKSHRDRAYIDLNEKDHIALAFDLRFPLEEQLVRAEDLLTRRKEELKKEKKIKPTKSSNRSGPKYWKLYLQILDATHASVPHEKIISILSKYSSNPDPDKDPMDRLNDNLKAARKLCNGDYLKILKRHFVG